MVWQVPDTNKALVVEAASGATNLWVEGTNFSSGSIPHNWSASSVREGSSFLGTAVSSGTAFVVADNFSGGNKVFYKDFPLAVRSEAVTQLNVDGGPGFVAITRTATNIKLERSICVPGCSQLILDVPQKNDALFDAVADSTNTSWVAARIERDAGPELVVYAVPDSLALPTLYPLARDAGMSSRVELSTAGAQVHVVWLPHPLELVIATPGGTQTRFSLPEPARLVDAVENGTVGVVVLEFANHRSALLLYAGTTFDFYRVSGLGITFQPVVAHLGTKLRLAGHCIGSDGGPFGDAAAGCAGATRNPVIEFPLRPNGTAW